MAEVKRSVRLAGLALIAFVMGTALLLTAETLFRFRPAYGRSGFSFDRHLIWRPTPNLSAAKAYAQGQATGKEPFALHFNNRGFRGRNFVKEKTDGVKRIMVLGDSYTAGLDYPDNEIFTGVLEQCLNAGSVGSYEVYNVSAPAWGADQQYAYWTTEGKDYQPDYLVMTVAPNDMREMYNKKLLVLGADGGLELHKAWMPLKQRAGWWLASHSCFFQFLQLKVLHSNFGDFFRVFRYYPVNYGREDSTDWDLPIFLREPFPEVDATYTLFEKVLAAMKEDCERKGTKLVLLKIPTKSEFDGSYTRETHDPLKIANLVDSLSAKYQLPLLNLNHQLKQEADPLFIFMHWEYHFNDAGHRYVGEQLCRFFKEELR